MLHRLKTFETEIWSHSNTEIWSLGNTDCIVNVSLSSTTMYLDILWNLVALRYILKLVNLGSAFEILLPKCSFTHLLPSWLFPKETSGHPYCRFWYLRTFLDKLQLVSEKQKTSLWLGWAMPGCQPHRWVMIKKKNREFWQCGYIRRRK